MSRHIDGLAFGEGARLVELASLSEVHRVRAELRADPPDGVVEIVAGARSVLLIFSESGQAPPSPAIRDVSSQDVVIPAVYDGADLAEVARLAGLSVAEVVARHTDAVYTVAFLGFSPGFAYLVGGDPALAVPRMAVPRPSVPAGSVAVAADMTAVYPQSTPGGWRLLGRTDVPMFDPWDDSGRPARLAPGDRVRFEAVPAVGPVPVVRRPGLGSPVGGRVQVLSAGGRLTVQDRGRVGWAHAGVPRGGAADRTSAALANSLVGNEPGAALFESTIGGARLRVLAGRRVAITGAACSVTVDGMPARINTALTVPAGAELILGRPIRGLHSYVAVAGGLAVEPVLGSRSTDTLSGLGPAPLQAGDVVALGDPDGGPFIDGARSANAELPASGELVTVRALLGPREEHLGAAGVTALEGTVFTVSSTTDRTGVRLDGPALPGVSSGVIPSEGMVPGAVQLPPGGHPVVLLRNHPPTGGYPVVAVVDDADVDVLAQCPPGVRVRFVLR